MNITSQIREYFQGEIDKGRLDGGSRLPTNHALMKMFGVSYATIHSAMNRLKQEGFVEIRRGAEGTYLTGGNVIPLRIFAGHAEVLSKEFLALLRKYAAKSKMRFKFYYESLYLAYTVNHVNKIVNNGIPVLTISGDSVFPYAGSEIITSQPEYEEIASHLQELPNIYTHTALPFTYTSSVMGINRKVFQKIGMDPEKLTLDFCWWDQYVELCRRHEVIPVAYSWKENQRWFISAFLPLLLALCGGDINLFHNDQPLFSGPVGEIFFKIIDSIHRVEVRGSSPQAGLDFSFASNSLFHSPISLDDFILKPYRLPDGRKIQFQYPAWVSMHLPHQLDIEQRKRVWRFMQLMISRDFQLEFVAFSGLMSLRTDILPREHAWNSDGRYDALFETEDCVRVSSPLLMKNVVIPAMSILLANYKFYHEDPWITRCRMDQVKQQAGSKKGLQIL